MFLFAMIKKILQRIIQRLNLHNLTKNYWAVNQMFHEKLKDHCVVLFSASLGDTFFVLSNKAIIEQTKHIKIYPVIRKSHQVVAKLCGCTDYAECPDPCSPFLYISIMWRYKCFTRKSFFSKISPVMEKGSLFFAHPNRYDGLEQKILQQCNNFLCFFQLFLQMDSLKLPGKVLSLPYNSPRKFNFKKTIIFCPEAHTVTVDWDILWGKISIGCKKLGYDIFYNAEKRNPMMDKHAEWLDETFETIFAIAQRSAFVIALRSGLCDLLAYKGARLVIINPDILLNGKYFPSFFDINILFARKDVFSIIYSCADSSSKKILNYLVRKESVPYYITNK